MSEYEEEEEKEEEGYVINKKQDGYTITETLAAITLVSMAGMIALNVLSSSVKGMEKFKENLDFAIRTLLADEFMQLYTGAINIPYWERKVTLIEDNNSIQIPWYGGRSRQYLRFFWDEHSLGMETGNEREKDTWFLLKNPNLEHISVSALTDEEGVPYGLNIVYTFNKKKYHIKTPFGSGPVQRKRP
jgi:hypothetical protein